MMVTFAKGPYPRQDKEPRDTMITAITMVDFLRPQYNSSSKVETALSVSAMELVIATCLLVSRVIGVKKIEEEVTLEGKPFRRKKIFYFMIQYLCPIFAAIILISSVANAFGWISM